MRLIVLLSFSVFFVLLSCVPQNADPEVSKSEIHALMDSWHLAASEADEDKFYGLMTEEAIYIGTDSSERWKRDELRKWATKAFEREVAWDFKAFDREVYISKDGQTAWFEEKLNTWMGTCIGSGVLTMEKEEWKISHYHLGVTISNEKIKEFIEIEQ